MLRPREPQRAVREQGEGDVLVPQDQDSGSDADGRFPARNRVRSDRPGRQRNDARADGAAAESSPGARAGDGSLLPPRRVQPGHACPPGGGAPRSGDGSLLPPRWVEPDGAAAEGRPCPRPGDRPLLPPRKLRRHPVVELVPVVGRWHRGRRDARHDPGGQRPRGHAASPRRGQALHSPLDLSQPPGVKHRRGRHLPHGWRPRGVRRVARSTVASSWCGRKDST
jgi:hypothetical protein